MQVKNIDKSAYSACMYTSCSFTKIDWLGALCMLHVMNQVVHVQVCKLDEMSA